MLSYQYRHSHVKDKTVSPTVLSLTWESSYLGKTVFILRRGPGDADVSMNWVIISSGNTWLPDWHQALTWTNVSTIGPSYIEQTSFEKIHLKVFSVKWRLFRSGLIVLHISMQCWKNIKCKWIFFYQNITQKTFWIFVYIWWIFVYIYMYVHNKCHTASLVFCDQSLHLDQCVAHWIWYIITTWKSPIQCKPDISRLVGSMERYRDISENAIYRATVTSQSQTPFSSALWTIMGPLCV